MAARFKAGGVGFYCDGYVTTEVGTSTCQHCGKITDIPSQRKLMEYVDVCRQCMKLICLECVGKPCTPLMKKIERHEEEFYRKQQLRKMLGV